VATLGLMYHDVVAGDPSASGFRGAGPDHYKVPAARFERHLDAIEASGLAPSLVGDEEEQERRLLLTFDDGGRSASTETAPMLERRGWRGHFFVTTDRIGTAGFLEREEIVALHEAGHVVGSHACTHCALPGLDDAEMRREWSESKAVLEDLLGTAVTVASVPTGRYTARVGLLAAEAGYEHIFTIEPWLEPRALGPALVYGRFSVYAKTSPARIAALCSLSRPTLLWMGGGWYARKAAKALLGPVYDPLRRRVLARIG
jgi:peptidoglycan/xylan/chitin deacetylase (PgdA/CDA1 family)